MDDRQSLTQNLVDAGCDHVLTKQLISLMEQKRNKEALMLLAKHRKGLLESCHVAKKKISCLDYLVYCIEQDIIETQGGI